MALGTIFRSRAAVCFVCGRYRIASAWFVKQLLHCMTRPTGSALHRVQCLPCTAWLGASTIAYSHTESHQILYLAPRSFYTHPHMFLHVHHDPQTSAAKRQMNQTSPAGSRVRRACLAARTPLRVECQNRRDGYAMSACFRDSLVKHGQLRGTWTTAVSHVVGWCKSLVEGGGGEG
jgi:hypothetical protein